MKYIERHGSLDGKLYQLKGSQGYWVITDYKNSMRAVKNIYNDKSKIVSVHSLIDTETPDEEVPK